DELTIGRIFRPIVQSPGRRQARLRAALDGDGVDVELPVALAAESQRLAVGRPAVPVRRSFRCDEPGRSAGDRQRVDERLPLPLRLVTNDQLGPVGGDAVVVVAARGETGVDRLRLATGDGYAEDAAAAVDDQRAAVTEPVGRFDARGRDVDDAAV